MLKAFSFSGLFCYVGCALEKAGGKLQVPKAKFRKRRSGISAFGDTVEGLPPAPPWGSLGLHPRESPLGELTGDTEGGVTRVTTKPKRGQEAVHRARHLVTADGPGPVLWFVRPKNRKGLE